ncbi:septal ring lytic transglycosylase RlpA family protein [Rufibacter roseus]|uniref:Probable endolytic peptidoglycan transglycosylase RlpA n=1 Tax=Rufibacter roseus TaxID=1567108 RepID=A0ABW2DSE3_9BACT|nr:septal ring lytic transglycosylase RlpA family protein [Rufibacter roseus]
MKIKLIVLFLSLVPLCALASRFSQKGMATFYSNQLVGKKTSSGEPYDPDKMTAAHASLPLNSYVKVLNVKNGRSVVVKINDRMSRKARYVIDVSQAAAKKLGIVQAGMGRVQITKVSKEAAMAVL